MCFIMQKGSLLSNLKAYIGLPTKLSVKRLSIVTTMILLHFVQQLFKLFVEYTTPIISVTALLNLPQ